MPVSISQLYGSTVNDPSSLPYFGPLGSLYNNKYTFNALQYPRDLQSPQKGHVVKFDFYKVSPITLNEITTWAAKGVTAGTAAVVNTLQNTNSSTIQQTASAALDATVNGLTAAGDAAQSLYSDASGTINAAGQKVAQYLTSSGVGNYSSTSLQIMPRTTGSVEASVSLYMPDTLSFEYKSEYTDTSLAAAAGSLPLGLGKIPQAITSTFGPEGNAALRLALNAGGYVFNPQQQLLFQGINFRTFNMTFTFTPYSAQDAENVKQIIKTFRKFAAPTVVTGLAGFFFNPPGMLDITFLYNGAQNTNLNLIKRSVITDVEVNYAPNGWAAHENGAPVQTVMTVGFQEMVLVDSAAIDQGY